MAKTGTNTSTSTSKRTRAELSVLDHFSALEDPRQAWKVVYPLPEILLLILSATIASAEDFVEIEEWGNEHLDVRRGFLPTARGIPSHDALNDLVNALDPELFKACFTSWVTTLRDDDVLPEAGEPNVIAIDGKTSRRTHNRTRGREPLHLVSAWAARQRLVLGQQATSERSNEIKAIPLLLQRLAVTGALVTIDAMGTQVEIAQKIIDGGGDDCLALKANHPLRHAEVERFFADPKAEIVATHPTTDGDHGRIEVRTASVSSDIDWLQDNHDWPGLKAIGKIVSTREMSGKSSTQTRYDLLSAAFPAARFNDIVRSHWAIENSLHWVLDVTMGEDQLRNRLDHGPENLAMLRHLALNVAKLEPSKGSIRGKLKRAGWNDGDLLDLLAQFKRVEVR